METYKSDGYFSFKGILLFLLHGLSGGLIGSAVIFFIEWKLNFSLIIFFPAIIGFTAGIGAVRGIKKGALRNHTVSRTMAVLVGVFVYFSTMFFSSLAAGISFPQFLRWTIESGFKIRRAVFAGIWVYLIWLVECGITTFVIYALSEKQIGKPFCRNCSRWTEEKDNVFSDISTKDLLFEKLQSGDFESFGSSIIPVDFSENSRIGLNLHKCPDCSDSSYLTLVHHYKNEKNKEQSKDLLSYIKIPDKLTGQILESGNHKQ